MILPNPVYSHSSYLKKKCMNIALIIMTLLVIVFIAFALYSAIRDIENDY